VPRVDTLLDPVEALAFRTAMALPRSAQRVLAGRRVMRDGQTLDAELQLALRLEKVAHNPAVETVPIPEGRRLIRKRAALVGGEQPIGTTRDVRVGDLPGRLYVPEGAAAAGPLMVFFHGGAWIYGDLDSHDPVCRFLAEQAQVRVLAVDYRLAPEHPFPAAHDDGVAAYRWVVENADTLGVDPARLAVGGDSAGGTIAATTAIAAAREGLPLAMQLLVYPATDMRGGTPSRDMFSEGFYLTRRFMDQGQAQYLRDPDDVNDPRASPVLAELPTGLAPAYVVTAGFDPLRDEAEAYARKLADAGALLELRRLPQLIHGFLNLVGAGRSGPAAVAEIAARVRSALS
jgi:acetyl esterase